MLPASGCCLWSVQMLPWLDRNGSSALNAAAAGHQSNKEEADAVDTMLMKMLDVAGEGIMGHRSRLLAMARSDKDVVRVNGLPSPDLMETSSSCRGSACSRRCELKTLPLIMLP
ncbi:hypothetical protein ACLOJK_040519 [Asimina triloba]